MVFYRKYRPQKIEELDLVSVRTRLESILKSKEIPHAFLFTGPKGLGKTSSARILAKAINCEKRKPGGIEPCNECDACKTITNGSNMDVIEIDAASNRGIDEIRELREKIKFSPASLQKKVYIIDEVHMLTTDAFNALLKTLEEPPSHAIFILCTTEEWKVLETIKSRTFHVGFEKPAQEELLNSLKRVVNGEKLNVDEQTLNAICSLSEGSFRDGVKILEELSFDAKSGKITNDLLESIYRTKSIEGEAKSLLLYLSNKDLKNSINVIENVVSLGIDFKIFTEKMVNLLHASLMAKSGLGEEDKLENVVMEDIEGMIGVLNASYKEIRFAVLPQLPIELAAMEWCLNTTDDLQLTTDNEKKSKKEEGLVIEKKETKADKKEEIKEQIKEKKEKKGNGDMFDPKAVEDNFFSSLIAAVKKDNHSIAGMLRGCKLVSISDDIVKLETPYKFHKDKLNEVKIHKVLQDISEELLQKQIKVIIEMKEKE